jgi:hypothetical protein
LNFFANVVLPLPGKPRIKVSTGLFTYVEPYQRYECCNAKFLL